MVPEPSPRFFSAGGTTSNGGVVPHPMGTLLVAFGWPCLPSLLFEGMFQAARWDFFGVLCHTGALLEAVRVTCCCRRQQRGQRCSNLYPLPILRLIPVPPQGEAGGATSPWDLARWDPNPEPLSPSCGSLLVSQVASTLINPRPGGVGGSFPPHIGTGIGRAVGAVVGAVVGCSSSTRRAFARFFLPYYVHGIVLAWGCLGRE